MHISIEIWSSKRTMVFPGLVLYYWRAATKWLSKGSKRSIRQFSLYHMIFKIPQTHSQRFSLPTFQVQEKPDRRAQEHFQLNWPFSAYRCTNIRITICWAKTKQIRLLLLQATRSIQPAASSMFHRYARMICLINLISLDGRLPSLLQLYYVDDLTLAFALAWTFALC